MRVIRGLWDKNVSMRPFNEVMAPNIGHDLGAGQDLNVEFMFKLATFLTWVSVDVRGLKMRGVHLQYTLWTP
jgi:hypothetical protein